MTNKEMLIEKIINDYGNTPSYRCGDIVGVDDIKQILQDTIPEQVDYENEIKHLINKREDILKLKYGNSCHWCSEYLKDLQSLLPTTTNQGEK